MSSSDDSTMKNFQLYQMIAAGTSPVSLLEMKAYLGGISAANDVFLQTLIDSCTQYGQLYTGREFTINTYQLFLDCFDSRLIVRRNPVDTITSITYLDSANASIVIDAADYYLKKGVQYDLILESPEASWPTDISEREQSIAIIFVSAAIGMDKLAIARNAIMRHVSYMFANRGDCEDCGGCAGKDKSGANGVYDMIRIPRV